MLVPDARPMEGLCAPSADASRLASRLGKLADVQATIGPQASLASSKNIVLYKRHERCKRGSAGSVARHEPTCRPKKNNVA